MAIVVLLLWAVTAGAGLRLLFTSGLGRRPVQAASQVGAAKTSAAKTSATVADEAQANAAEPGALAPSPTPESAMASATAPVSSPAQAFSATSAPTTTSAPAAAHAYSPAQAPTAKPMSARAARQARYDPPTLTRNKNEPIPGLGPLLEFAHPMFAIVGLAFWLGYSLVHNRALAWIAFGLAVATICAGISWFTANARAAKREHEHDGTTPAPAFSTRLIAIHGAAAALTFALAALTALTARG